MSSLPPPSQRVDWNHVADVFGLSPREIEVAALLIDGHQRKAMALELGCSIHTIDTHLRRLYRKVGRHRRDRVILELLRIAG